MASELETKIIRQIEYYFGDANLPRDRFLQEQIKADEGWVPFETMIKFNRLKQISEDLKVIAEAMKKSTSGLIQVNEDNTKLRRNPDKPIPENTEERRQDLANKTIYAKPFPLDATLDQIQNFFNDFGELESVFMRKDAKKAFKGSVFVTFKDTDSVEKFLKADSVKFNDAEVDKRMTKSQYYKSKSEEKKQQQEAKQQKKDQASERQQNDEKRNVENELVKGALLHMKGIGEETRREDIRNMLQDYGPIAWIEFNRGDTECYVRYDKENKAKDVLEQVKAAMNDEITLNDCKLEARVLEGDEEVAKWNQMFKDMRERAEAKMKKHRNSKNFQKGRWGKRPSKHTRDAMKAAKEAAAKESSGEPPEKKVKVELKVESSNGD